MNIALQDVTEEHYASLNEDGRCILAEKAVIDGAIELTVGGLTVAAIFEPDQETQIALAVLETVEWTKPGPRIVEEAGVPWEMVWDTPAELAEVFTEEELEYMAWASLKALETQRAASKPVQEMLPIFAARGPHEATPYLQSYLEAGNRA